MDPGVYLAVSAKGVKQEPQGHLLQSFSLLLASVISFLLPLLRIFGFVNFAPVSLVVSSIGVTLCAVGMAVLVWARQHLGRNWSQTVTVKEGHELVTSGPYHHIRHPMYAGGLVACVGSAIVCGGAWSFFSSPSAAFSSGEWAQKTSSWPNNSLINILVMRSARRLSFRLFGKG